jgi:hypothetical protein
MLTGFFSKLLEDNVLSAALKLAPEDFDDLG